MQQLASKISTLACIFSQDDKKPIVACKNLDQMLQLLQSAIDNYQMTFARSLSEIQQLRQDLSELEWANRELKIAVRDKNDLNR